MDFFLETLKACLWLMPCLALWLLLLSWYDPSFRWTWSVVLRVTAFFCVLVAIFHVTGTLTVSELFRFWSSKIAGDVSLIPFSGATALGLLLNVFLFVPVGFCLPFLWDSYCRAGRTVVTGFLLSCLVEVSQMGNLRATDVDDLLMNTLGTVLGFVIFRVFFFTSKRKKRLILEAGQQKGLSANLGLCMIAFVFVCHFFLSPLLI